MSNVIHKVTKEIRRSVHTPDYDDNWVINPKGLHGAIKIDKLYRKIDGKTVREATEEEKITIEPLRLNILKQAAIGERVFILHSKLGVHVINPASVEDVPAILSELRIFVDDVKSTETVSQLKAIE